MKTEFYLPLLITTILFLCSSVIEIKAQDSLYLIGTITGESSEKKVVGVKGVGDVNGDGYGDFMISIRTGKTRSDQGIAELYLGSANADLTADVTFHYPGKDSLNDFGNASGIGDVNGDGYDDFTISGSFGDWGFPKSKVFLYYGGETIDTIPVSEFYQPNAIQDNFGNSVVSVGDINKDNYDDFAIGSSFNWTNSKGYVYLFWGGDTISWERSVTFTSDVLEDFFGESVANIGDVNKDGFNDIAIGATAWISGYDTAKVYIFYGGRLMDTEPDTIIISGNVGDEFGRIIKNLGDVNNDGAIDFCIVSVDSLFIYTDLYLKPIIVSGYSLDGNGDINGDGYGDLIVGNDRKINVYLGAENFDTTADIVINDSLRYSTQYIYIVGDLNNDGFDEVVSFAPNFPSTDNPQGKIYIYSYKNIVDVNDDVINIPNSFQLYQNYPNPFNPSTIISWQSPVFGHLTINIFDVLGKEVATLLNEGRPAGRYEIKFDASKYKLSNGVYIYRLITGNDKVIVKKMLLIK